MIPIKPLAVLLAMTWSVAALAARPALMPLPAVHQPTQGSLSLAGGLSFKTEGPVGKRVLDAADRLNASLSLPKAGDSSVRASLIARDATPELPTLGMDESYELTVTPEAIRLSASGDFGLLRGLATLRQLVSGNGATATIAACTVQDSPRFPWRGLLVDVCRHWIPPESLKRQLEGMAAVKLNVLHLHITEDQGFRIECKAFPKLHGTASDGHYYTQDQIREVVAFAAARGIRVVPEFDMPGHTASWLVAYPELGSLPGPYELVRKWGIFDPVFDPTNESLYPFLDTFFAEMAGVFPDPYFHIGGDEVNGVQWNANPAIQAFIREHKLGDNHGLQAHFNRRIAALLAKQGCKLMGWDEILHPDMPTDVIQSWRGSAGLAEAVKGGRSAILSHGYYIDLIHPAIDHYRSDPIPAGSTLTAEERSRVLGGEATMWAEWIDGDTIDSRVWPRTAAIAERLWSPQESCADESDLYPRLDAVAAVLATLGSRHERYVVERIAAISPDVRLQAALRLVADTVEPVKIYARMRWQSDLTSLSPLDTLADAARPDSAPSRRVNTAIAALLEDRDTDASIRQLGVQFASWSEATAIVANGRAADSRLWRESKIAAAHIARLAAGGRDSLEALQTRKPLSRDVLRAHAAALLDASRPDSSATEFVFLANLRRLLAAGSDPSGFFAQPAEARSAWLDRLCPPYEATH